MNVLKMAKICYKMIINLSIVNHLLIECQQRSRNYYLHTNNQLSNTSHIDVITLFNKMVFDFIIILVAFYKHKDYL